MTRLCLRIAWNRCMRFSARKTRENKPLGRIWRLEEQCALTTAKPLVEAGCALVAPNSCNDRGARLKLSTKADLCAIRMAFRIDDGDLDKAEAGRLQECVAPVRRGRKRHPVHE